MMNVQAVAPMKSPNLRKAGALCCSLLLLTHGLAHGGEARDDASERQALLRRLAEQTEQINALKRAIAEQEAGLARLRRAVAGETLGTQRGRGPADAAAPAQAGQPAQAAPAPQQGKPVQPVQAAQGTQAGDAAGQAQQSAARPQEVAQIFEQPGVLTPGGNTCSSPPCSTAIPPPTGWR